MWPLVFLLLVILLSFRRSKKRAWARTRWRQRLTEMEEIQETSGDVRAGVTQLDNISHKPPTTGWNNNLTGNNSNQLIIYLRITFIIFSLCGGERILKVGNDNHVFRKIKGSTERIGFKKANYSLFNMLLEVLERC